MFSKYRVKAAVIPDWTAPLAKVAHSSNELTTSIPRKKEQGFYVIRLMKIDLYELE